ncbi:uncharacterized protein isoform X2 [Musca autumnalis]|uniref:uncharacterized protein isoform X2 n=1 Tax=Musca autumnalis TaxID=221902 RepID=UPI003CF2157D
MDFKVFLLITVLCCCYTITHASGYCYITLSQDESVRPKLYKYIGSRKAFIRPEGTIYNIQENEVITADCETRILSPSLGKSKRSVDLKCIRNYIYVNSDQYHGIEVVCDRIKWNLYESLTQFRWCPMPMASYLLARPVDTTYEYLAGVCYNFYEQQILTLHYAAAYHLSKYKYPNRLQSYTPSLEITNIPTSFTPRRINSTYFTNAEIREWMEFSKYENHSLIQDPNLYRSAYDKFGGLLEFDWWPSLRSGNWRLYEKALWEHIETDKEVYDVLAGVSDSVAVPIYENACSENYTMVDVFYNRDNKKIPLYVWQYLKSNTKNESDVVVIGINSAFSDFYVEKDLIFCTDICHKIDWLKQVRSTFRYKTMGVIFCCDVNEVKNSKRLQGFPLPSKPITTTTTLKPFFLPEQPIAAEVVYDDFNEPLPKESKTVAEEYSGIPEELDLYE